MDRSGEITDLVAALVKVQGHLKPAAKDHENPHFRSRYADLASIWEACRELLSAHGLAVVQAIELLPEGLGLCLRTTLLHTSGQFVSSMIPLSFQAGNMQAMGSAITYARRFGLAPLVGIVADDDDDGNLAAKLVRASDLPAPPPRAAGPEPAPAHGGGTSHGHGMPRSGKGLFAWAKEKEQHTGVALIKHINGFAKSQGFPGRMVDFDEDQVQACYEEALRQLSDDVEQISF